MPVDRERVAEIVRGRVAEALALDLGKVTLRSSLSEDLGAESLDLLDILYRLDLAFGVRLPQRDFRQEAEDEVRAAGDVFEVGGVISGPGLAGLRKVLPEVPAERFRPGLEVREIPMLYTVETLLDLVIAELRPVLALALLATTLALGSVTAQAALPPTLDTAAADAVIHGEAAGDYHGRQLYGGGDVNGDGYEDLLIGAYGNDAGGNAAGKAYLILGGVTYLGGTQSVAAIADASWIGEHAGDYGSLELAICPDLDADGRDELLIGAYHSSDGGAEAGKIYLVYGRVSGWTTGTSLAQADASFLGTDANDHLARSVSGLGDVDGDGLGDWQVGGCWNSDAGYQAGKIYLVFGAGGPWGTDLAIETTAGASFVGEHPEDWAGRSIAGPGDVDGDGLADLLIGAYGNDDTGSGAGKTYLVLGRTTGWTTDADLGVYADAAFTGESPDDRSGLTVAGAGDVNGDGLADMLICAYRDDDGGSDAGATYLVLGDVAASYGGSMSLAAADAKFTGEGSGDNAGRAAVGLGDLDGDGYGDLLISAPECDAGGVDAGRAYLLLGSATWTDVALATADTIVTGHDVDARFGYMLGPVSDLDGGGHRDLVIAAYYGDTGYSDGGDVHVWYTDGWFDDDGDGLSEQDGDCDDGDATVFPGAPEVPYDGIDQDCDGADLLDADGDGHDSDAHGGDDCDDSNPTIHPGAPELCLDGVDNNCDGAIDWIDADGDGINDCLYECKDPLMDPDQDGDGAIRPECGGNDCDDLDPAIFPGAVEVPYDGIDQDCDGEDLVDVDEDGWDGTAAGGDDCDDGDPDVNPGADEVPYDGVDNDCDGGDLTDVDGDGFPGVEAEGTDCNDEDAAIHPDAEEICDDGVDNDCDGAVDLDDIDCEPGDDDTSDDDDDDEDCEEPDDDAGDDDEAAGDSPATDCQCTVAARPRMAGLGVLLLWLVARCFTRSGTRRSLR